MTIFKFGDNVKIEGVSLNCDGKVRFNGAVTDVFGQPLGTIGLGGQLLNQNGDLIGKVQKTTLSGLPSFNLPSQPQSSPGMPSGGVGFESFEQKRLDDQNRIMKDIEGGYEWFKK
jgi:hypothetical protein